eukprot:GHUV01024354.1.p2 GENE.GHUV01024354.1~~GHUV01024354.1.p2  ORF type:complete len:198 (-),score=23.42 GHUV01024354.1:1030-1623(-)
MAAHLEIPVFLRHWRVSDLIVVISPHTCSFSLAQYTLETQGACHGVMCHQITVALLMYCMSAGQYCYRSYRVKQKLAAHRAVLVHAVCDADVAALHGCAVAAVACAAVEEVATATNPADSTVVAMELLLGSHVVKEVTLQAAVRPKPHTTAATMLRYRLPTAAQRTDNFLDLFTVQGVTLLGVLQHMQGIMHVVLSS